MAQAVLASPSVGKSLVVKEYPPTMSIKELVEKGLSSVPENYGASTQDRPPLSQPLKEDWETPVIDISHLQGPGRKQTVDQIARACQEWGFFHVVNHGVPEAVVEDMWQAYDMLFALPPHERAKFDEGPPDILKKLSQNKEKMQMLANWRDTMRFRELNPDDEGAIPHAPQFFRKPACEFYRALRNVGLELLEAISESLGMEAGYIHNVTGSNLAINTSIHHYSPCPDPLVTIGLNPHTDIDTLTVLLQDETGGLQILKEDRWVDVKPLPDSLVVNVGEALQVISNKRYKSVLHRVNTNTERARSSISCFLLPTPESVIGPLAHLINEENPAVYTNVTFENLFYNYFAQIIE